MPVKSAAEAVERARQLLGLPPSDEGSAWLVRRLDEHDPYFLVHISGQVTCVDASHGALIASATTDRAPVPVTVEKAKTIAALGAAASATLVWKPCAATLSMFDPLWWVTNGSDQVFIDQREKAWSVLSPKRPGGGDSPGSLNNLRTLA